MYYIENEVFEVNSFVLYCKMGISKKDFSEIDSILMYYIEK